MKFSHPLARAAKVWSITNADESVQPVLVVVTTLELDPGSDRYRKNMVNRLSKAVREHLAAHPTLASSFVLINRLREWDRA